MTDTTVCYVLQDHFPFKEYFADAPGVLFRGNRFEEDVESARGCWRHLRTMFQELEECRAFELLKVGRCCLHASLMKNALIVPVSLLTKGEHGFFHGVIKCVEVSISRYCL